MSVSPEELDLVPPPEVSTRQRPSCEGWKFLSSPIMRAQRPAPIWGTGLAADAGPPLATKFGQGVLALMRCPMAAIRPDRA